MKKFETDIDIDVFNREEIVEKLGCISASIQREHELEKHSTGVYFQNIPRDPFTNTSTIDYKVAGDYGYFKIDLLNVYLYENVKNEEHLLTLMNTEPEWELFEYEEITDQLFHLHGYSNLLKKYKPKSVEDLAMILAIIRPAKAYLQKSNWKTIREEVWIKHENDSYQFRRGHALAYALAVIVHLNLLIEKMIN